MSKRTMKTYKNKIRNLKKYYRLTFKHSKKNKETNKKNNYKMNKKYFCDTFPTEKSFINKIKIREPNI